MVRPAAQISTVSAVVRRILLSGSFGMLAMEGSARAVELPQPCIAGTCGATVPGFVTSGVAQATQAGNTLTVNQATERATLNWSSFNVSADGRVVFNQPSRTSIALNRIWQDSPSRIFGQVQANGEVYLVNPNGLVFGRTSQVNAAGILASTLNLSDEAFAAGIASPSLLQKFQPALDFDGRLGVIDAQGRLVLGRLDSDGRVIAEPNGQPINVGLTVQHGAKIATSGTNGRVLLASQKIDNSGSISAPDGQVILAAGDKVYLAASSDPALRGLLVEVGTSGTVTNTSTGDISTPRGNTTLIGYAVNQQGRISATTTVAANGSIRLLARDSASVALENGLPAAQASRTGTLLFGASSVTEVTPELSDAQTAVDDQKQELSRIEGVGHQVTVGSGSRITVKGGTLKLSAVAQPLATVDGDAPTLAAGFNDPQSQLRIEGGAHIDLSGSDATLPMSRNQVTVELRANELRDSPVQRNSAIRGQPLVIDARVGTPLGDVSGAIAAIPKTVAERTAAGGSAVFASDGDIVVAKDAVVDVSGGQINYASGYLQTSQLVGADGKLYDVGTADPNRTYVAVVNPSLRVVDDKWGRVSEVPYANTGQLQSGYVEGRSAGSLQFIAPTMVLNGQFRAATVVGPYQRTKQAMPLGGAFIVGLANGIGFAPGLDYRAPSVTLSASRPNIAASAGAALPAWLGLTLPTDYLQQGFTRTTINSNGTVSIVAGAPLELAPGSTFSLNGQAVHVDSSISSPGGSIVLATRDAFQVPGLVPTTEEISLGRGVRLDVGGAWINDSPLLGPVGNAPLLQDAGSIALRLGGTVLPARLSLADDVALLANGGGWYRSALTGGRGGSVSLLTSRSGALEDAQWLLGSGIRVEGFGTANAAGGSFTLDAPAIRIGQDTTWLRAQTVDAQAVLGLGTSLFSDFGFAQFRLQATRPGLQDPALEVMPGATLQSRVLTRLLSEEAALQRGARSVDGLARVALLDPGVRQASRVSLATGLARGPSSDAGTLAVDAGAVLEADPGSSFNFSSIGSIELAGSIRSSGGSILATLLTPPTSGLAFDTGYRADQRIELSSTAVLDVAGGLTPLNTDDGRLSGNVTRGGTVSLIADRGRVAVEHGSQIDLSGGSAQLDVATGDQAHPYQRQQVGSAAGALTIKAREGAYVLGSVSARGGADSSGPTASGTFTLEVNRTTQGIFPETYPQGSSRINVTTQDLPVVGSIPAGYAGISQSFIARSGFDAVSLRAFDSAAAGQIDLGTGVDLQLGRSVALQAPVISLAGGNVKLSAPYVSLGDVNVATAAPQPATGSGALDVRADSIELLGATQLDHAASASFASSGDLRLRGANLTDGSSLGSFAIAGDLTLSAARIYASTRSQFAVNVAGGATDRLRILQSGSSPGTPLSAASQLSFTARSIQQDGSLYAPFGSLLLKASESLTLGAGGLTSVSGAGALIPYGYVLNGAWLYDNGRTAAPPAVDRLPSRSIALQAATVSTAPGATLDISGGGDLYAYEWVPGTGGSKDALAAGTRPGLYAVLPSMAGQLAPYDPQEYANSDLAPGETIYLSGHDGIPAGFYPLLPARYGLLPGAFLVSVVPGTADYIPGSPAALRDGTTVISGYRSFAGTGLGGAQLQGIAIRPGTYGRQLADYTDYKASSYLPALARRLELGTTTVPLDSGSLSLFAGQALDARGIVKSAPAAGGRGASISVSAPRLAVTAAGGDGDATTVDIAASTLASWAPASLRLGAAGSAQGDDVLEVTAQDVYIRSGTALTASDLLVAAQESVQLEAGASLSSPSAQDAKILPTAAPRGLQLSGTASQGAAILALSDLGQTVLDRAGNVGGTGTLRLDAGSTLATRGALLLDAPAGASVESALRMSGADVALGADRLVFSQQDQAGALTIGDALQQKLQTAATLALTGNESIRFERDTSLALTSRADTALSLTSANVVGADVARVELSASRVSLQGTSATAPSGSAGDAALTVSADEIGLSAGNMSLSGFRESTFTARRQLTTSGEGSYRASGDLSLVTPGIVVGNGGQTNLAAAEGTLRLRSTGTAASAASTAGLGGALRVAARHIEASTAILAPSGKVVLDATESLSLTDAGSIDVAGRTVTAASRQFGSQGGSIELLSGGSILSQAGTRIDVSGSGDSPAGSVIIEGAGDVSLSGSLRGQGPERHAGGEFELSAGTLAQYSQLNASLEQGGFTRGRQISLASGDLLLAAGERLSAQRVELSTAAGSIRIDGTIDASSIDDKGSIRIDAGTGVSVGAAASLITDTGENVDGGADITLGTAAGQISLAATARFSASGSGGNGELILRVPVTGSDAGLDALPADLSRLAGVIIAPVFTSTISAAPTAANLLTARQPAIDFANSAGGSVLARLGSSSATVSLRPEIQLRRDGDVTLGAIDLSSWRFAGQPGTLSVIATGDIRTTGTLNDGFTGAGSALRLTDSRSSSLRLLAGRDLVLGANSVLRMGTGDIDLRAGRDLVFGSGASVYTGGLAGAPAVNLSARTGTANVVFPDQGGSIDLRAGRDVLGNGVVQSVTDWQFRGTRTGIGQEMPRLAGISLSGFGWNVGTLGGGDVDIHARGSVKDLAAAASDSTLVDATGVVRNFGGGSLAVSAQGDIDSSQFFVGQGRLDLRAGDALGASRTGPLGDGLGSLLWMADTQATATARSGLLLESVLNPTALLVPNAPNSGPRASAFFSYSDTASLQLQSASGDVSLRNNVERLAPFIETVVRQQSGELARFALFPPRLDARAYTGDIDIQSTTYLFPSAQGNASLFAGRDLYSDGTGGVMMSDGAAKGLSTLQDPAIGSAPMTELLKGASATRHALDAKSALFAAGRDVRDIVLSVPTAAQLSAGRDVRDISLVTQNVRDSDVTLIAVGRDLVSGADNIGSQLLTGGPGRLDILAGRDVDLGFSQGVVTSGSLRNATLPTSDGASISILAGLGLQPDQAAFIDRVIAPDAQYRDAVATFMSERGTPGTDAAAALRAFRSLDPQVQRPLVSRLFFSELVKSGREANQPGGDFSRGYAAIDALFPNSRTASGENSYRGDINMSFSRIYTLAGGDISLLAPGGLLNVGLANPPPAFGSRSASELGIVAQREGDVNIYTRGDVLVNQSRIFTLLGGDIAIWSTLGNIDAGRGAKSSLSAPPPTVIIDDSGKVTIDFSAAVAGSGIRTVVTGDNIKAGDVDLIAPVGFVNAGDAGIGSAGNLNVAAQSVVGLDNIQVGGVSTGVPAETSSLGASLSGVSAAGAASASSSSSGVETGEAAPQPAPLAQTALTWLDVFVEGFGDETCKPSDEECLKRNRRMP